MDFPDSPEAVALALLRLLLERDAAKPSNAGALLDLFAECLRAARGERCYRRRRVH
jgi:hypothetical protein